MNDSRITSGAMCDAARGVLQTSVELSCEALNNVAARLRGEDTVQKFTIVPVSEAIYFSGNIQQKVGEDLDLFFKGNSQ